MLNGVNQSSFRSFRGFKENICARFFFCNQSENCEHTHGLVKMQQIPPQFSGGGSCPWLFVNISFKVKLAHCYLLSSPFSGASHLKFDWNCLFCELVIFCREDLSHCFSRAPLDKTLHVENFAGVGDETWMTKKAPSVKKGFVTKISVAEIFAKLQVWDEKLRQMHEIGKRVGIRRKRRSTEWNIFTVEDLANSRTEIKKKVKLCL